MQLTLRKAALCAISLLPYASNAIQITGPRGGQNETTGVRPFRREITDLAASGPSFDLYIQALNEMQATDQSDPLSYFQIAGMLLSQTEKVEV